MRESKGLMGLPAPALGYDGVVQTPGGPIKVTDGVMKVGQKTLDVSVDGQVTDEQGKALAKVVNGKLTPLQQAPQQPQQGGA